VGGQVDRDGHRLSASANHPAAGASRPPLPQLTQVELQGRASRHGHQDEENGHQPGVHPGPASYLPAWCRTDPQHRMPRRRIPRPWGGGSDVFGTGRRSRRGGQQDRRAAGLGCGQEPGEAASPASAPKPPCGPRKRRGGGRRVGHPHDSLPAGTLAQRLFRAGLGSCGAPCETRLPMAGLAAAVQAPDVPVCHDPQATGAGTFPAALVHQQQSPLLAGRRTILLSGSVRGRRVIRARCTAGSSGHGDQCLDLGPGVLAVLVNRVHVAWPRFFFWTALISPARIKGPLDVVKSCAPLGPSLGPGQHQPLGCYLMVPALATWEAPAES